ncbi:MAG: nuclear transport factor 2 family protein [Bacteroidota bacterium]
MKFIITLFLLGTSTASFGQISEYEAVAKTVNYYLEGGTNSDKETLMKAFHEDADVRFVDDKGEYKSIKASEFFGGMKPGPKSNRKTRIANINITGHAANAHLVIESEDFEFNDYMTLLKIDGEWKIIMKIFFGEKR